MRFGPQISNILGASQFWGDEEIHFVVRRSSVWHSIFLKYSPLHRYRHRTRSFITRFPANIPSRNRSNSARRKARFRNRRWFDLREHWPAFVLQAATLRYKPHSSESQQAENRANICQATDLKSGAE